MLPKQLSGNGFRFVKILTKEKAPFEKEWTTVNNYTDEEIKKWVETGANYGVLCGNGLVVIDTDTPEAEEALKNRLQPTFTVKTRKGMHRYYFCDNVKSMKLKGGDLQSNGKQVVGPGSIHPTEVKYEIVLDYPIKKVKRDQLFEELKPVMPYQQVSEGEDIETLLKPAEKGTRNDSAFKIATFFRRAGRDREAVLTGLKEWNKTNKKPLPLSEIKTVVDHAFKGDEAYSTFFKQDPKTYFNPPTPDIELEPVDYTDLVVKEVPPVAWIVDGLIPAGAITVLAGKRSSFKSWIAMDLALSAASGGKFLGRIPTKRANVLYINNENDDLVLVPRLKMLHYKAATQEMRGRLHFLNFSDFSFTEDAWTEQLEAFILNHQIELVICDPFSGTFAGDENDAVTVRGVFTRVLGRIANNYTVGFFLIHHMRKGQSNNKSTDKMDELRGSSEFANYVSSIIVTERPKKGEETVVLYHAKNRAGEECAPARYSVVSDEESLTFEFQGYGVENSDEIEACIKKICLWADDGCEFKTADVLKEFKNDFSRANIKRALTEGVRKNFLDRFQRGKYLVRPGVVDTEKQEKLGQKN